MAHSPPGDIEDLALCSVCKLPFDDGEQLPKVLACKHHFCLRCVSSVLLKGRELYCPYCWKRTEPPDLRPEALPTHQSVLALARRLAPRRVEQCRVHALPHALWCATCQLPLCRGCASQPDHQDHAIKQHTDARRVLRADFQNELALMHKMLQDIQQLAQKQRDFLLKILEACTTLKTQVETDLVNNAPGFELAEARERLAEARHAYAGTETMPPAEVARLLASLAAQRERMRAKHKEMFLQCRLDDLIKNSAVLFDFELLKRALATIHAGEAPAPPDGEGYHNPVLFLANYCMSQLYSRHFLFKQQQVDRSFLAPQNGEADYQAIMPAPAAPYVPLAMPPKSTDQPPPDLSVSKPSPLSFGEGGGALSSPGVSKNAFQTEALSMALPSLLPAPALLHHSSQGSLVSPGAAPGGLLLPPPLAHHSPQTPMVRNPSQHVYPIYYFNIEINGSPFGRILVEVRNDVAPKMAKNFGILASGELGIGYKGCNIFQCWENESIITGDFELNNGRGGRSIFDESFFMPDDTKIMAIRGSVGMRRSQKRHDNLGLVGSQFRIILREMRGFTGIFAFVVEGLDLVDRISQSGDSAGKPQSNIVIANCGKFN